MTTQKVLSRADIGAALTASVEQGGLLLDESDLGAEFFDLSTGFAGELLQRFVNYRARLAVVVADPAVYGGRFRELVHEHRTNAVVRFFSSGQLARQWLSHMPVARC